MTRRVVARAGFPRPLAPALALVALATPLLANGGTVRISRQPVGSLLASVFSSPTPLRTGEVDISVLVQDSAGAVLGVPVLVEAVPVAVEATSPPDPVRQPATRQQATNKLFRAAKFDVGVPGEWEFRVRVGEAGDGGADGGVVSFRATLAEASLLDRPYLLALLVLAPALLIGWLLSRREESA